MLKTKRKKVSSLILTSILIPSLLFTSGFNSSSTSSAASSKSIHSSAKSTIIQNSSSKISKDLQKEFKEEEKVTFLIKLKEQVDTAKVAKEAASNAKKQKLSSSKTTLSKRSSIVTNLRATAEETQHELKNFLEKQEKAGNVKDIQSFYIVNGLAVTATKEVMEQIATFPEVEKISPNETVHLIEPVKQSKAEKPLIESNIKEKPSKIETKAEVSSIEWNIDKISAPQTWAMGIDGAGTVIASIDTGVQWDHPTLKTKYRGYNPANPDNPNHEFSWFDATSTNNPAAFDDNGHGTHTIGTMVGSEPNGANQIGVAPGAKFIAVKALNAAGSGTQADLLEAGEYVLAPKDANGTPHPEYAPDVVNNSWGGAAGLNEWFRPMVQAWKNADIFPEFSAGNSGPGAGTVNAPSNYPESYATAATDINNALASFSSRGPSPYEGVIKPNIAAPGVNIRSAIPGNGYASYNGTSMAGPHVSAVVALLRQADSSLTVDQMEEIMELTATPLTDSAYPESPNYGYGHGLVNAFDAVSSVVSGLGKIKGTVSKEGDDTQAPEIETEPVTTSYKEMDLPLSATATDDVSVTSVVLKYKKADGSWTEVAAERVSGDYKSGEYEATIPGADLTGDSTEYQFIAYDFGGNSKETAVYPVELLPGITVGYETDFEQNPIGWTTYGTNNSWEWGVPTTGPGAAFSGEKVYATNLTGNYANSSNMSLEMPPIDLPEGASYLQFKQWFDLERNYDYGHVFISTDGSNWTQAARFNQTSNGWIDGEVDLSEYAGQRIYISFNVTTDGSVQKAGWYLDDVKLSATPIQPSSKAKNGLKKDTKATDTKIKDTKAKDPKDDKKAAKEKVDAAKIKPISEKDSSKNEKPSNDKPGPLLLPIQAQVTVLETGRSVYTNPQDGSYELTHATGDYTVQAETYGFQSQTQTVRVEDGGVATANFTLQEIPKGTVSGTITNKATGDPVAGATVYLVEDAAVAPVTTNEDGEYSITAYEGTYTLKFVAPSYYSSETTVTIEAGEPVVKNVELRPFIGYPGEIKYDDGTAENARAFNAAGNSWAVKMSLKEGEDQALVTGALLRFWDTTWPNPGGTEFQVSVYDASGSNGGPGNKLAGPFNETALRDGTWTHVDLTEHGIMVEGDFFIVYTQTKANPNSPGLATDEDGPNAKRSWQGVSGAWSLSPEAEGNYMIRATVNYELQVPTITSPKDGSFTNKKSVTVEGKSSPETSIDLFNDGEKIVTTETNASGDFSVAVELKDGVNTLTAKAKTDIGSTDPSAPITVTLDQAKPELAITSPTDGSKTNKETVTVTGTITDANLDWVKVNGQTATVSNGKYSKRILLDEGINDITVQAKDKAGNSIKKTIKIDANYTAPELSNLLPATDKVMESGDSVKVEFDSEPGLDATFSILVPLTNLGVSNALELPMRETSEGHYVGYYTATKNIKANGAAVQVTAEDDYGNKTVERAEGLLYINAPQ